jgi:hypothetical protein
MKNIDLIKNIVYNNYKRSKNMKTAEEKLDYIKTFLTDFLREEFVDISMDISTIYCKTVFRNFSRDLYKILDMIDDKNTEIEDDSFYNKKDSSRYKITFYPIFEDLSRSEISQMIQENNLDRIPKKQLPTIVIKYLIIVLQFGKDCFQAFMETNNKFGRSFANSLPDVIYECESEELFKNNNFRQYYNEVDFSKYEESSYKSTLYICNQWDKKSITEFIKYVNNEYSNFIIIEQVNKSTIDEEVLDFCEYLKDNSIKEFTSDDFKTYLNEKFGRPRPNYIPSDYCFGKKNKGINYDKHKHYFRYIKKGHYTYDPNDKGV